jgi:hypothetical protein
MNRHFVFGLVSLFRLSLILLAGGGGPTPLPVLLLPRFDGRITALPQVTICSIGKEGASMDAVSQVNPTIQKTLALASRCTENETSDNYGALEDQVGDLESRAREAFQTKMDFTSLLPKLEKAQPLTPGDLKTLELLIVGDAEYYLKYETEVEHWKGELKRVLGEIAKLQSPDSDVDGLMHLRALCREAREVLADLVFYFDAQERAGKFQAATQGTIDADGYRFLAKIVRQMWMSEKM